MNRIDSVPELSPEQWTFIAVLDAFNVPISIELAGHLAPLLPGPLFDLLEKTQPLGWIKKYENNFFGTGDHLPIEVKSHLQEINSPKHLDDLTRRISQGNGIEVDLREKLILLDKAGWIREAGEGEIDLAHMALKENHPEEALLFLEKAVKRFTEAVGKRKGVEGLFLSAVLELSNLCFSLGQGFAFLENYLLRALKTADRIGDRRSHVLLQLHLGRLYYFSDRRNDALVSFSKGFEGLEELDDEDIREQSAQFLGIFFFIKGYLKEALEQFDKAEKIFQQGSKDSLINPATILFLGYCATFLGQFHQAIGSLDFHWRLAMERSDPASAGSIRSVLGTILVLLRKDREGLVHLQQAQKEAEKVHNAVGLYFARGGLGLHHFIHGRVEKAYDLMKKSLQEGRAAGLIRQFAAPWILEMLYEFHRLGFEPIPDFQFPGLLERLLLGVNVHLKGVAFRIRAKESLSQGSDRAVIERDLSLSEECLKQAGDPVQLSKTILERAKLELGKGQRELARELIQKAKGILGGYGEEFFPDEFRHLLEKPERSPESKGAKDEFQEQYLEMIESLSPGETQAEIFNKMLISTSRMFGAERSGLFWFPFRQISHQP